MIKPVPTISRKPTIPVVSWVCTKATAIKTGMKVPEVLSPTITRKNTTIKAPIGINMMVLNMACSSSGKLWIERLSKPSASTLLSVAC